MRILPTLSILPLSLAALITVSIPSTPLLQNPSALTSSTHAVLSARNTKLDAPITRTNEFVFRNISSGSYLLSVYCRDYVFEDLRIDVSRSIVGDGKQERVEERIEAWQTFRGNEWDNKGEKRDGVTSGTVEVRPIAKKQYLQERQSFSVLSLLKSPMILMALFSLAMIVGMPYLMDNMDPESKAEFEEMQKNNPLNAAANPSAALQNFDLAGWMAGATSPSSSSAQTGQASEQSGKSAGGPRRR